jgi:hypothetical protein
MEPLFAYFRAEKQESFIFVLIGVAAFVFTAWMWSHRPEWRPAAWPLVLIGLIQISVGGSVGWRTTSQVQAITRSMAEDRPKAKAEEEFRMVVVMRNFQIYKAIEIAVLLLGISLLVFGRTEGARAAGWGCVIQAALMLIADGFAEARGRAYLAFLRQQ